MANKRISLLAVAVSLTLAACNNSPSPLLSQPARVGADKSAPVTTALPPAGERHYDPGIAPENEEKGMTVGSVVAGDGGQRTQKDKERKEQAAIDAEQAKERADLARQQSPDERTSSQ